jgi:hypothetical protein
VFQKVLNSFYEGARATAVETFESDVLGGATLLNDIAPRGGEGFVIPKAPETDGPFYFGIDCRSESETKLGKFPKVAILHEIISIST